MEYGSNLFPPRKSDSEPTPPQNFPPPADPDPALKPGDLADLSHRYFTHFTEVCTICSRRFRSTKWLKAHLVTDHGQAGAEKWNEIEQQLQNRNSSKTMINSEGTSPNLRIPNGGQEQKEGGVQHFISNIFGIDENNSRMYQCSSCSFTTPLLPLLFVHERSHSTDLDRLKCPVCPQTFIERELLQRHVLAQHPFVLPSVFKDKEGGVAEGSKGNSEDGDNDHVLDANEQSTTSTGHQESGDQDSEKGRRSASPSKMKPVDMPLDIGQSLKDVAKRTHWPATYAIPQSGSRSLEQDQDESTFTSKPGYVMQAFLLEESTSERRVMPSVVFLPMLQKQPAPITITFTLTPA